MSTRGQLHPRHPAGSNSAAAPDIEASRARSTARCSVGRSGAAELGRNGRLPAGEKGGKDVAGVYPRMAGAGPALGLGDLRRRRPTPPRPRPRSASPAAPTIAERDGRGRPGQDGVFADPAGAVFGSGSPSPSPAPSWSTRPAASAGTSSAPATPTGRQAVLSGRFRLGNPARKTSGRGRYLHGLDGRRGRSVGGMIDMNAARPAADEVPPNWLVYFTVEDARRGGRERSRPGGGDVRRPDRHPGRPLRRSSPTRPAPPSR